MRLEVAEALDVRAETAEGTAGLFVTGTGTEVGKTVVAAVLAHTAAAEGRRVAVFKPALTGLDEPGRADHAPAPPRRRLQPGR